MKTNSVTEGVKSNVMRLAASITLFAFALSFAACANAAEWETDMEKAKKQSAESEKPILVVFTGSDWCPPCKRLKSEVFDQKEFADYAEKNLVLVELDFPQRKTLPEDIVKQNQELQKKYGIRGYPTVLLLDAEGKEFGRLGYGPGGVAPFVTQLKELLAARG